MSGALVLSKRAAQMISQAVETEPALEVSGFGRVEIVEGCIVVTDVIIPEQEVGAAHTDIEDDALDHLITQLASRNEVLSDWAMWWHSHCSMATAPSGQDTTTLSLLADHVPNLGWFCGLVTNVRDEYHTWVEMRKPVEVTATIPTYVSDPAPDSIVDEVAEMMKGVKKKSYTVPAQVRRYQGYGGQGYPGLAGGAGQAAPTDAEVADIMGGYTKMEEYHKAHHKFAEYPNTCDFCGDDQEVIDLGKKVTTKPSGRKRIRGKRNGN